MRSALLLLVGFNMLFSSLFGHDAQGISCSVLDYKNDLLDENRGQLESNRILSSVYYYDAFLNPEKSLVRAYELAGKSIPEGALAMLNTPIAAQACCPEFILKDAVEICPPDGACPQGSRPDPTGKAHVAAACKNISHTYTVFPNDPSFTYTWTVTGGTPSSLTGNPISIVWGTGGTGTIKVVMSNYGTGGSCLDSIKQEFCLIDGPKANFSVSSLTTCINTPVNFTNTSLGGSVYLWKFGDGTTSSLANPPAHSYSLPGTYTVVLIAQDMGSGQSVGGTQGTDTKVPCGCTDSISKVIVVNPGAGPVIDYDCCFGTVCAGDTSAFCTPMTCGTYTWSCTGGTIISGLGTNCIKIKWDATYSVPTTVSLQSCPSSSCPGTATLNVPVLYPNLPINGPVTLCVGTSGSYSLPWLPGTYYHWTVLGGGLYTFNQVDKNTTTANITFSNPGVYIVKCVYNNPMIGCSGMNTIAVNVLPVFSFTGDEKVCEGNTVSYTANGPANWIITPASGATIVPPNNTPVLNVSFAPGTYTITANSLTPSAFCNAFATKIVEVIAKPVLGSITGLATVCPGSQSVYDITSNVTGSPFNWSVTPGTGSVLSLMGDDNESAVIGFTGSGTWVISVYQDIEISPNVFCSSITKTLTVNSYAPPVITGPASACIDAVMTYTASGITPPDGFQWSIAPPGQGTIQSGQGTNSVNIHWHGPPTTAQLTVTNCGGTFTLPVTINGPPTPVASYNMLPLFCQGATQTLTLSTPPGAGYSYVWYLNGSPVVPAATGPNLNINISPLAIGTYQYYVIVTVNGCSAKSNSINLIIENCAPGGPGGGPGPGGCDAVAFFRTYVVCGSVTLVNNSSVAAPNTITNYSWSVSGPGTGIFSPNNNVVTPTLSVNASGTYTISLTVTSSSGCTSTWTETVNVFLPNASFTYTTPVCTGTSAFFVANPSSPANSYAWDFGDTATSFVASTQHAYNYASPPPKVVNLVITDPMGCIATASNPVTVNPSPSCVISAPGNSFCPGDSLALTACGGMTSYQWYKGGIAITGATSATCYAKKYGQYWVQMTNSYGCTGKSNKMYVYMKQRPKALITGDGYICAYPASNPSFQLSTIYDPNYSYAWSSNPAGATFTPGNVNNPTVTLTLPLVLPVTYQFIVDVTDVNTGCVNSDTLCVTFFETPPLTVTNLNVCEPASVTLTPVPNNTSLYSYMWNNGAKTPVITASAPGFYSLTITDKANGCSASANAGFILAKPDLSLFPLGCDSICSNAVINFYIPLPLNALPPNNNYPTAYPVIKWYDNGNFVTPIGTGQSFPFSTNVLGNHQISVSVTNSNGCTNSAGVFCLNVRNCPPYYGMDFGDVPDDDVSPGDYPTLLVSNGARHLISPNVYLGTQVDAEPNGQPSFMAVCDDNDCLYLSSGDDEDGVNLPPNVIQGASVPITVIASVPGYLDAWVDFNIDQDWSTPGEHIFTNQLLSAGSNTLSFTVPVTASTGQSYARFRFRTANNSINFFGLEQDGEVEDYAIHIDPPPAVIPDFGDVPDNPNNPNDYPTLLASNGARHNIVPGVFLGSLIDAEGDGQPSVLADGDDVGGVDDEDGVIIPPVIVQGSTQSITVTASVAGYLDAWMDFNIDGDWADPGEHIFSNQALVAGPNTLSLTVPFASITGQSYTRFRFRTSNLPINYFGLEADGEVEDYAVYIEPVSGQLDFGDVPDDNIINTDFPTLLISNGARHLITPGVYLGSKIDAEPDGQPSYLAVCDDNDCMYPSLGDDEDGVNMPSTTVQGSTITLNVVASTTGFLDAWMDFNVDSDWADAGEHIFTNQPLNAGSNTLSFVVPVTASAGISYSRFRFRTSGAPVNYDGLVADGEVEDYSTRIKTISQGNLDFGDVPDDPSNPSDFPTLLASNGARHNMVAGVFLGSLIDAETDGQPNFAATGDDLANVDDEDGVIIPPYVQQGSTVTITVLASTAGFLDAWFDFNGNNTWGAGAEHIFNSQSLTAGSNTLTFTVPPGAALGQCYGRFRFRTSSAPINFDGLVSDGEVEDYTIHIDPISEENLDFGDAPDNPQIATDYPTWLSDNGARHFIVPNVFLGTLIDAEANGQPNINSTGDDTGGVDDEDGVTMPAVVTVGSTVSITVVASVSGFLDAWIDYNIDGDWADLGEHIYTSQALNAGSNTLTFTVPAGATTGQSYSRFRFRTSGAPITYSGQVADGEVEDYAIYLEPVSQGSLDFGDAPDNWDIPNDYPTLLASNGARHNINPTVYLGSHIDAETDGQPNFASSGDDLSFSDDEDGITLPPVVMQGSTVSITAQASVNGFLDAWMDFNIDGDWSDPGEHIFTGQALTTGSNSLTFNVPAGATMGTTYSRFRFRTSAAPINYDGLVSDGEVEDYSLFIESSPQQPFDFGDVPDNPVNAGDYPTLLASNGARHTITGNTYLGYLTDAETDGQPSVLSNGDNLNNVNDEDGVTFLWPMSPGNPCKIKVVASLSNALLNTWIDFNGNGSWADPGEHVFNDITPVAGNNFLTFIVPANAVIGNTYARFRYSHQPSLSYAGAASDGEVEDYQVNISKYSHKWMQLPDEILPGLHSDQSTPVFDDWVCNGGTVTQFDWWGNYEMLPTGENRGGGIGNFQVNVYSDGGCQPNYPVLSYTVPFSEIQELNTGTVNNEASIIYKYSYILPIPYDQLIGHTYWLSVTAIPADPVSPPAWRWQEANRWTDPIHCPTLTSDAASGGWQPVFWPDPEPGQYSDMAFSVINNINKTLNVKVYLEGLYESNGVMHKAQDETGNHFPGETADEVTVELHDAANYSTVIETFSQVPVTTAGDISISSLPAGLTGSYYITVKHRNSVETTTAEPVSFSGSDISFDFTTSASKAFGANQKSIGGVYVIFSGDVNSDGVVDDEDISSVAADASNFLSGYRSTDLNGDGIVDAMDLILLDNNSAGFVVKHTP